MSITTLRLHGFSWANVIHLKHIYCLALMKSCLHGFPFHVRQGGGKGDLHCQKVPQCDKMQTQGMHSCSWGRSEPRVIHSESPANTQRLKTAPGLNFHMEVLWILKRRQPGSAGTPGTSGVSRWKEAHEDAWGGTARDQRENTRAGLDLRASLSPQH